LDEGDETQMPAQLRIDGQLPEHQSPSHDRHQDVSPATELPDDDQPPPHAAENATSASQLYRHLDIQA